MFLVSVTLYKHFIPILYPYYNIPNSIMSCINTLAIYSSKNHDNL